MDFVAGIDGGGTKTTLLCWALNGEKLQERVFGAFNINSIGERNFTLLLKDISTFLLSVGHCLHLVIGAAGVSNEKMRFTVDAILSEYGIPYTLVGDHVIALEGAHGGQEGLAVIAGTGSICFGKGKDGLIERAGGWGHIIGDDGSAYALGRDALRAIANEIDGVGEKTFLRAVIAEMYGLRTREEIIKFVYNGDKATIASIAPAVDKAYIEGDETAIRIVKDNASALSSQMVAVLRKLNMDRAYASFFGGLINKDTPFKGELIKVLSEQRTGIEYRKAIYDAATGAVMLALRKIRS